MELIREILWNIIGLIALSILPPAYLMIRLVKENRLPHSLSSDIGDEPLDNRRVLWMMYISLMTLFVLYLDNLYNWIWIGGILLSTTVTLSFIRREWVDILTFCGYLWILTIVGIDRGTPHWVVGWGVTALIFSWIDERPIWVEIGWWVFLMASLWIG
jgi:hypothetical protein